MEQRFFRLGFSRNVLKYLAMVSMVSDHIAFCFLRGNVIYRPVYLGMRIFGRISFPLFCFLLVQGFLCTRNVRNYFLRIFIFACLSEVPFDLFVYHRCFSLCGQNVLFTLGISLLVLYGLSKASASKGYMFLLFLSGSVLAVVMRTDYSYLGVVLVSVMYLWRERKPEQLVLLVVVMGAQGGLDFYEILALPFIMLSSDRRLEHGFLVHVKKQQTACVCRTGKLQRIWEAPGVSLVKRYFFYWFYPVHILCLVAVRAILSV